MPLYTTFYDELIGIVQSTDLKSRVDRLWLGGTAGPSGGQGVRPGGYVGQLIQSLVAYDTTEAATLLGSGSLVDNLNHIRYNVAVISGILSSGVAGQITVRELDLSPSITNVEIITFDGATLTDLGGGEVLVEVTGGTDSDIGLYMAMRVR